MAAKRKEAGRVTGVGGVFLRSPNPKKLSRWYRDCLGVPVEGGMASFTWASRPGSRTRGLTLWSAMASKSPYWGKTRATAMVNYRVTDLDAVVALLTRRGAPVEPVQATPFGRFAWVTDPDGNRVELWEPPKRFHAPKHAVPMT